MTEHLSMQLDQNAMVQTFNLSKFFPVRKGVFGRRVGQVHAVDGISLSIKKGETLGLVGESGCGKSTLGRTILKLVEPTGGSIYFDGKDITRLTLKEMRPLRNRMQIIFQDPFSSLDPRFTVKRIISEGFAIHGPAAAGLGKEKSAISDRVLQLVEEVGLAEDHLKRFPHEFSGGQKQRIALARALSLNPDFIVLDEPTSALDVSVQAQILNLLRRLQSRLNLTFLFISHDLSVVEHISDRVAVMYLGQIIEMAPVDEFFKNILHPYAQALVTAIPVPNPRMKKERGLIEGEVPSPINPPNGCRFNSRCPLAEGRCRNQIPAPVDVGDEHLVACHKMAVG